MRCIGLAVILLLGFFADFTSGQIRCRRGATISSDLFSSQNWTTVEYPSDYESTCFRIDGTVRFFGFIEGKTRHGLKEKQWRQLL